jgi:hypothetical protein
LNLHGAGRWQGHDHFRSVAVAICRRQPRRQRAKIMSRCQLRTYAPVAACLPTVVLPGQRIGRHGFGASPQGPAQWASVCTIGDHHQPIRMDE